MATSVEAHHGDTPTFTLGYPMESTDCCLQEGLAMAARFTIVAPDAHAGTAGPIRGGLIGNVSQTEL